MSPTDASTPGTSSCAPALLRLLKGDSEQIEYLIATESLALDERVLIDPDIQTAEAAIESTSEGWQIRRVRPHGLDLRLDDRPLRGDRQRLPFGTRIQVGRSWEFQFLEAGGVSRSRQPTLTWASERLFPGVRRERPARKTDGAHLRRVSYLGFPHEEYFIAARNLANAKNLDELFKALSLEMRNLLGTERFVVLRRNASCPAHLEVAFDASQSPIRDASRMAQGCIDHGFYTIHVTWPEPLTASPIEWDFLDDQAEKRTWQRRPVGVLCAHGLPSFVQVDLLHLLAKLFANAWHVLEDAQRVTHQAISFAQATRSPSDVGRAQLNDREKETQELRRAAATDQTILLLGPTGTGKSWLAERIAKDWSHRKQRPFVQVNCATLDDQLLLSQLFGHKKGAFTGAHEDHPGLIEEAEGGTVFLDEIAELSAKGQSSLLRLIETRKYFRIQDNQERTCDVRFIVATNTDLLRAIEAKTFREDLYWRIAGYQFSLKPLRDRADEIPSLARLFLEEALRQDKSAPRLSIDDRAMELLRTFDFPGNIRQLRSLIFRAVTLVPGGMNSLTREWVENCYRRLSGTTPSSAGLEVGASVLSRELRRLFAVSEDWDFKKLKNLVELVVLEIALDDGSTMERAAARLRIDRSWLRKKTQRVLQTYPELKQQGQTIFPVLASRFPDLFQD